MNKTPIAPKDISFSHVVDMYLAELRQGKAIPVEKLARALPHLADEIREQLPALALLERAMGTPQAEKSIDSTEDLGGCQLVREVGRGAVGVVFEAFDRGLDRRVAVKVIPLQANRSTIAIDRFELERRAMARLEHPHIVPVYSSGHNSSCAYLVMKLIDGCSLYALQSGSGDFKTRYHFSALRSSWESLATLGLNVASGLHHAHKQGLVHRDIKPGNLLMDTEGKVWISDFGLAKVFDIANSLSRTGDAIGTPRYMAPEQIRGICDVRSDVYALGITMYELATGNSIWSDKSSVSILTSRHSIELPDLQEVCPEVPEELSKIIMKACQFSPEDRYQTADEMYQVLLRFIDGKPRADRRVRKRLPDDVYRKTSRRDTIIACSLVMLTSFCIATFLFLSRPSQSPATTPQMASNTAYNGSAVRLIDKLADRDQDNMVKIVSEFVEQSLSESGQNLQFSEPAKQEIRNQVANITTQIKTTGLTEESLEKFLNGYRKSPLPIATKIMRLATKINASGLSGPEKRSAVGALRSLATATINGYITEQNVDAIISDLIGFHPRSTTEVAGAAISDQRLQYWIADLKTSLSKLPNAAFVTQESHSNVLKDVFEGAFGETGQVSSNHLQGRRGSK